MAPRPHLAEAAEDHTRVGSAAVGLLISAALFGYRCRRVLRRHRVQQRLRRPVERFQVFCPLPHRADLQASGRGQTVKNAQKQSA
jgi:hypothetical protein